MNKVILQGRLTKDIELKNSTGSTPIAIGKSSIAVPRQFKKEGQPDSDFLNLIWFGKNAEFAEKYFKKGQQILISGRLQTGNYEKDGVKHYTTDILVDEQFFCGSKSEGDSNVASTPKSKPAPTGKQPKPVEDDSDDLPF